MGFMRSTINWVDGNYKPHTSVKTLRGLPCRPSTLVAGTAATSTVRALPD